VAGGDRSGADAALLAALAGGASIQAAAQLAGVSESTAYRRLRSRPFRRRLDRARQEMLDRALGHLSRGGTEAAITLRKLLRSEDARVKLGAAKCILESGAKVKEAAELERRIAALEEQARRRARKERPACPG
jgi:hypothetical protein